MSIDGVVPQGGSDSFFSLVVPRQDAVEEVALTKAVAEIAAAATAAQLGDLFEYRLRERVTIRKDQSALVPILTGEIEAEKVSLWNASTGHARPLRAIWLTNSTGLTLDGGSFSLVDGDAFAGEGLVDPLRAGEKRLVSYALDLGLHMGTKVEPTPARVTRVQIARGILIQLSESRERRTYTARNEDTDTRVLVIEHPARAGWTLTSGVKPVETTAAWHRFRLVVEPKTTATLEIEESRELTGEVAVGSLTTDHVELFVRDRALTPALEAALREVLTRKTGIVRLMNDIATRERELAAIAEDQARLRENMKALSGSSEERQLRQRYVRQLEDQETRLDRLRGEVQSLAAERDRAQAELARFIESMDAGR